MPAEDELLVRVEACGIRGTDRHLFRGEFPSAAPVTLGYVEPLVSRRIDPDAGVEAIAVQVPGGEIRAIVVL